ncbi:hypothetical protein [Kitasatospora sp. NPDC057500]|uniref:hypothetical protein n=1 Tax=Kitasatospora sp. NPDC057500 TaxID=3346151 RepID=UPI0036A96993
MDALLGIAPVAFEDLDVGRVVLDDDAFVWITEAVFKEGALRAKPGSRSHRP